ncbi:MAG: response regulator [Phycisphaerae bacterium]|nr:response regulator [Phycisphaerae bacterium]
MTNTGKKVLVVDDEIHILHVISLKLKNAGYEVLTARDGKDAFEIAQSQLPDMIITDYQMPYLSGLELCSRLKQIDSTKNIPAILLTARGFALNEDEMHAAGINLCINKPFGPRHLLMIVNDILSPVTAIG